MRLPYARFIPLLLLTLLLASCASALTWMAYKNDPVGPQTAGTLELPGLDEPVEVIRDRWGIPHIFAQNETDLMRAMGFVHAQDRLFQMDTLRRAIEGRISEVCGDRPLANPISLGGKTTVEQDIGVRMLGFEHQAAMIVELLPEEDRAMFEAYAEGVNAYLAQNQDNLPVEFGLVGYTPEPWRALDSIAVARMLAWSLASNAKMELLRGASDIVLGDGDKLLPKFAMKTPRILPKYRFPKRKPSLQFDPTPLPPLQRGEISLETLYRLFAAQDSSNPDASNNWVVSGERSFSGKPILANDPHLPHMAPSVFHLIHLAGAGYDAIGASLPGVPFLILGHNRHTAWAVTNCQADVQDVYLHKVDPHHPERYLYNDTWEDFVVREEKIVVKEGSSYRVETVMVRVSRFGPVITDLVNKDPTSDVLSLRWTGLDVIAHPDAFWELETAGTAEKRAEIYDKYRRYVRGNDALALRTLNRSQSCDDFFTALSHYGSPVQNWICGDDAGHIAYFPAGLIPVRNRGDGRRIAHAWKNEGRWIGYIPPDEMPQVRDPQSGYIVTANNQTLDVDRYPYPWAYYFVPGDRAVRIEELLAEREKVDAADMSRIQGDIQSSLAKRFLPLFIQAAKGDEALTEARLILERWDRKTSVDSAGAALFYLAVDRLVQKVVEDDIGPDLYRIYSHFFQTYGARMQVVLDKKHPFQDSLRSQGVETWEINYRRALSAAYAQLQRDQDPDPHNWQWGRMHTVTNKHTLGCIPALAEALNLGPYPHHGSIDTPWAAATLIGSNNFDTFFGPTFRHIVDMARPQRSWLVIDTGNWGQPLTGHYADLHEYWATNQLVPGLMDRADIEMNVEGVLLLAPVDLP